MLAWVAVAEHGTAVAEHGTAVAEHGCENKLTTKGPGFDPRPT
jgi:hypothetical protein